MKNNFELAGSVANQIKDENGAVYNSLRQLAEKLGIHHPTIANAIKKNGYFRFDGINYYPVNLKPVIKEEHVDDLLTKEEARDFEEYKKAKEVMSLPVESYKMKLNSKKSGSRYAVALFSDAHIEETVDSKAVHGKNEYNIKIAETRIKCYFNNLVQCLNEDKVDDLIFASLGDTISGYIHDELAQCNTLSPIEATLKAQSLIYSGLKFICENTTLNSITFIGIVGNHSRTTKRIQHANGFKLSYEWMMYKNIEQQCRTEGLNIDFMIPESEIALLDTIDGRRFLFAHGYQVRCGGNGTVCGIYPGLNRQDMKWRKVWKQDRMFMGHFHQLVSIPNAVVNGSIIGYNSFALSNGFGDEEPQQYYEVYDTNIGLLVQRPIYCK